MAELCRKIMVLGPTATGKTSLAVSLAAGVNGGEIISVDSRQVYRGLDVGSGKDINEYFLPDGRAIPHHLIDVAEPDFEYSLADFLRDAAKAENDVFSRGGIPFYAGGTALWLHAILAGYELPPDTPDPKMRKELASKTTEELQKILETLDGNSDVLTDEPDNRTRLIRRIELARRNVPHVDFERGGATRKNEFLVIGVLRDRSSVRSRIEKRLDERLECGMLDEAVRLHNSGVSWERLEYFGLEYRYMALHLQGKMSFSEMRSNLLDRIRQFAKRQDSWFRKFERDGFDIHWTREEDFSALPRLIDDFLAGKDVPPPRIRLSDINYGKKQ